MKSKFFGVIILPAIITGLYGFTLRYGFFQDDFYSLTKVQENIISWFTPGQEIYYRPLSMRVYFWLMNTVFGLQPIAYHLVALSLHFLSALLAGKITAKLSRSHLVGWTVSLLYATSAIHFISLIWIAEIGLTMGIATYLLAVHAYLSRHKQIAARLFIIGLFIHEYLITLPATLLLIDWYQTRKLTPQRPLIISAFAYLILRLIIYPLPATGSYSLTLGKPTLHALFWYGIWSLNIPENFKDQLEPGLKLNQTFLYDFLPLSLTSLITFIIIIIILFAAIPLAVYIQTTVAKRQIINRHIIFCVGWILITLSIPLVTPLHLYPMYASLALVGIGYGISQLIYFAYKRPQVITALVIIGWVITSWQSTRFMTKIHWTTQEATRVRDTYRKLSHVYPAIPPRSIIVIKQDYQIEQALYGSLGLQVLLNDPTLKTHFGSVDAILPPDCTMNADICLVKHQIYTLPP